MDRQAGKYDPDPRGRERESGVGVRHNSLSSHAAGDNDTSKVCDTAIRADRYHYFLMVPSVILIIIMGFTLPRKTKFLQYLYGRPGAVFPMDILSKRHRFSYAAAWGSVSFLAAELVLGETEVVLLNGPPYVTVFTKLLSMIVIGIDYFPLFASLAVETIVGYFIGTAYAWLFLAIQLFRASECDLTSVSRTILVFRDLPNILCLLYLSISLPYRVFRSIRDKSVPWFHASETPSNLNLEKDLEVTPEGYHVRSLLRPPPPPPPEPVTKKEKILSLIKRFSDKWVYKRQKHFRYSARVLSVMLMGLMVIYKITVELMVIVLQFIDMILEIFEITFETEYGWDYYPGEDSTTTDIRDALYTLYYLVQRIRVCFIVATIFACIGSIITILHMLSSYRTNLFNLYKGDNTHIPNRSTRTNTSLLVGSMRYAGYQVAYVVWGFVLQFYILFLVAVALCLTITLLEQGYYQWLLTILAGAWPALLMTLIVLIVQTLLAKFAFLHNRGEQLSINNRRLFFSFTFFMFFYNIFIGLLSCLLRIIKSIIFGTIFISRLDTSVLPRPVQMFDPGFANYCGFMHVECYHTHPVLLMFVRILMRDAKAKKAITENQENKSNDTSVIVDNLDDVAKEKQDDKQTNAFVKAKWRWLLCYTILNNPSLRVYRRHYIEYMKEVQERLTKQYHLNSETAGRLVSKMNEAFIENNETLTDIGLDEKLNPTQNKWRTVLAMNKIMKLIQNESEKDDLINNDVMSDDVTGETEKQPKWGKASVHPLTTVSNDE